MRDRLAVHSPISLEKIPFKTGKPGRILWYHCGPAVYDSSHMSHARSLISLDIIRRILADFFDYNVYFVMNVKKMNAKIIDDMVAFNVRDPDLLTSYEDGNSCSCVDFIEKYIFEDSSDINSIGYDIKFVSRGSEMVKPDQDKEMNFVQISDALSRYSWRQLRLAFLLHPWNETFDYNDKTMEEALYFEAKLNKFLSSIEDALMNETYTYKSSTRDNNIEIKFKEIKEVINHALCDNFDTKSALDAIVAFIHEVQIYLTDNPNPKKETLVDIKNYIVNLFKIFGAWEKDTKPGLTLASLAEYGSPNLDELIIKSRDVFNQTMARFGLDKKECHILKECNQLDIKENQKSNAEEVQILKEAQRLIPPPQIYFNLIDNYAQFGGKIESIDDGKDRKVDDPFLHKLIKLHEQRERRDKLVVYNSISRKKEPFLTKNSGKILWYNCGPTVYDSSHMGHARSYISLDIIRRILAGYFGYDIDFVMNITDIDDKIIKKARQLYLYEKYRSEVSSGQLNEKVFREDIQNAITYYENKLTKEEDPDKKAMMTRLFDGCKVFDGLNVAENLEKCKEVLYEYLDFKNGSSVTDNDIFIDVPRKYESEFFDDMVELNVAGPGRLTRVSEYVPQIVDYIEKIIKNGYAYESNQSVYFDTIKFSSSPKHEYAKLVPEAVGDLKALSEGEGVLSTGGDSVKDKKHPNDFALWKKSKPGEPSWESPWGKGRPGWHIECSVMASDTLGDTLDIHSGGYDLKFPHHDNEMAQSEAYYDTGDNWVNYFLHTGHLTISGCKMSKSLKNFITIKDALSKHSWRQLRLAFLLHTWNATLDYSDETMKDAISFEKYLNEFLLSIEDALLNEASSYKKSRRDGDIMIKFEEVKQSIEDALCDNFDTKLALRYVSSLISDVYIYLKDNLSPNRKILIDVKHYIINLMRIFGAWEKDELADVKLPPQGQLDLKSKEEQILEKIQELANFRLEMRQFGLERKENEVLTECDALRQNLMDLGVKLEDRETAGQMLTKIRFMDKEVLLKEIQEKKNQEEAKILEKERKKKELEEAQRIKDAQKAIPPSQLFINQTDKYSQ
uniref:Cysteine--tRNA ligase, cytoplasmic n=2 Tax=Tetranychus urticae TaxID=32264 RepID=T1KNQ3_TETUR